MLQIDPGVAVAVAVPLCGLVGWLAWLQARVRVLEERISDVREGISELRTDLKDVKRMLAAALKQSV